MSGPVTIGRNSGNVLQIDDEGVSGNHACIEATADGLLLRDLGSTNGTFFNREPVETALLKPGDSIRFAGVEAAIESPSLAPGAALHPAPVPRPTGPRRPSAQVCPAAPASSKATRASSSRPSSRKFPPVFFLILVGACLVAGCIVFGVIRLKQAAPQVPAAAASPNQPDIPLPSSAPPAEATPEAKAANPPEAQATAPASAVSDFVPRRCVRHPP